MGFDWYCLLILAAIMLCDRYKAYKDADKSPKDEPETKAPEDAKKPETPKNRPQKNRAAKKQNGKKHK